MPEKQRDEGLEATDKARAGKPVAPPERPLTEGGEPTKPDPAISSPEEAPTQSGGQRERAAAENETEAVASDDQVEAARVPR